MSFVTQDDVFDAVAPVLAGVFEEFGKGRKVTKPPFPRITFDDAMLKYGSDKPDLRNPLVIQDVSEIFGAPDVEFKAFKSIVQKGGAVRAIRVPGSAQKPRSFFDKLNDWAREQGMAGLGYIIFGEVRSGPEWQIISAGGGTHAQSPEWARGPIVKFIGQQSLLKLVEVCGVESNDVVFFVADPNVNAAAKFAGLARTKIAQELDLVAKDEYRFCWIVDFPMFAAGRTRGARDQGPADHQGLSVRHRLQRRRALLGRHPQPSA